MEANNVSQLVQKLKNDDTEKQKFLNNPMTFLESVQEEKPIDNKWIFMTIVGIVGAVLLTALVLGGIIIFDTDDSQNAKVPEFLVSIGSTALGALVGLLSPSPSSR